MNPDPKKPPGQKSTMVPIDFCLKLEMAIAWHPLDGFPSPMSLSPLANFSASFDTSLDPPRPPPPPDLPPIPLQFELPRAGTKGVLPMVTGTNEYDIPAV
jgi:hypothetical protein